MWWQYLLVFIGAFLFDVVPFPSPPAFTIMVFLQIIYDLNIWFVILTGVTGSILGRYVLTLYIPKIAGKLFNPAKNEDVQYIGRVMKSKGWKSQLVIIAYSLLPLPTTPLFIAAGMAKVKPIYIIPSFFIGKFTSDCILVYFGKYGAKSAENLLQGVINWQSILSLSIGVFFVGTLLFIDWRALIQKKEYKLNFKIWK
jgi:membrane protein DedA with SNARE-associated domain